MALSDLFTNAQLEIALGGASRLVQLANAQSVSDAACVAFIAEVRAAADADVYSVVQVPFDITDATVQGAAFLSQAALSIAVFQAWYKGTGGQAVPEQVDKERTVALGRIKELASGERGLGTETEPTSATGVRTVTLDMTGTRILRRNMPGFC